MKALLALSAAVLLTGCTGANLKTAVAADAATTYYALKDGHKERNPVAPNSAAGTALTGALIKTAVAHGAKRYGSRKLCENMYRGLVAGGIGAGANNAMVINDKKDKDAAIAGVAVGAFSFVASKNNASKFCKG